MTTLAYRNGVLAADRQVCDNGIRVSKVRKIARSHSGAIGGAAGGFEDCMRFRAWIEAGAEGAPPEAKNDSTGYLILPNRTVQVWLGGDILIEAEGEFFAEGSGFRIALGAMAMGADARKAVEIAALFDAHTGSDIDVLELGK